jgi:leucyl-tRNA synthetase
MGPYQDGGPYNLGGIAGTRRFLDRFWTLVGEFLDASAEAHSDIEGTALVAATHRAIKKVTKDLENLGFNTAIAAMMALVNEMYKAKAEHGLAKTPAWDFAFASLTQLLAPFAPHITEEVWRMLGHDESVHVSKWPLWDENLIKEEIMTVAVQINGKVRAEIIIDIEAAESDILAAAKSDENVHKYLEGRAIKKEIYVAGRLVSLVV